MSRPPNVVPSAPLNVHLPAPLKERLDLFLYSEAEQRIPKGAYQEFFSARIREWLELRNLDLAPWTGGAPGELLIKGKPAALSWLVDQLVKESK
jgi:hypothetical protein